MTQEYDGSGAPLKKEGRHRGDVHCTECGKNFVAELDYSIDGNHVAVCPFCKHQHFRVIKEGVVTEERWNSSAGPTVKATRVWKHDVLLLQGTTASHFIRAKWLEKME